MQTIPAPDDTLLNRLNSDENSAASAWPRLLCDAKTRTKSKASSLRENTIDETKNEKSYQQAELFYACATTASSRVQ